MTLTKWDKSVRIAKIKMGLNPGTFTKIQGNLLKESQKIYQILLINGTLKKALKGTNRGVHNHHFHAGFASK